MLANAREGQGSGILFRGMLIRLLVARSLAGMEGLILAYSWVEKEFMVGGRSKRDCFPGHITHHQGTE